MPNCDTTQELLDLLQRLKAVKEMVGWMCTNHRYRVSYRNNPESTQRVQAQLDEAAEFINVIYIYSILDEAGFTPRNQWIASDERDEFKAWVHIRHTGAHTPNGRANVYRNEFDTYMLSNQPTASGLKTNCTWDASSIQLPYAMSFSFLQFAEHLVIRAIKFCAEQTIPP